MGPRHLDCSSSCVSNRATEFDVSGTTTGVASGVTKGSGDSVKFGSSMVIVEAVAIDELASADSCDFDALENADDAY